MTGDAGAAPPGRILYGGTFNPPHQRHVDVALAALRLLAGRVDGVDLVPSARPPHKPGGGILPVELRCALVEAAIREAAGGGNAPGGRPPLRCNRMEGERSGPSYTWDTLTAFRAAAPGVEPYFLMGGQDYALLPTWRRGLELPALCRLVVAPRGNVADADAFRAVTRAHWPGAREAPPLPAAGPDAADPVPRMLLPGGGETLLLPLPPQAVSASEIRAAWLSGHPPAALLPREVLHLLEQHREVVTASWRENR